MALTTKKARKLLTKKEQAHLTEFGIRSMAQFEELRADQKASQERSKYKKEPCWICWQIEKKLKGE